MLTDQRLHSRCPDNLLEPGPLGIVWLPRMRLSRIADCLARGFVKSGHRVGLPATTHSVNSKT